MVQGAAANSGKKRKAHDLSRCTPGSNHCDKIPVIFEDGGGHSLGHLAGAIVTTYLPSSRILAAFPIH